ncbi:MAG: ABC transporter ATP-binding protein [Acidimicrobiales bacterium]|nr:ABC transporter ATP-binding protein [Acidimicrobiales bacterium]
MEDIKNPAVELTGVTKRFDDVIAVDTIDLRIADGEFFAMLGPSGCGKTTTLRMIAGLEFPTQGSLKIFGDEVGTLPPNKRPVNTVFQNYALFPHMNVLDNASFGLRMQGVDKGEAAQRAREAIEMVRLGGMEKRKPNQLSGGQQQRVALARALVNRPKVLLLDEPLGALDLKLRQEMQHELKELQRELGVSFVFVTHDQEEALTMSDRIAVMDHGKLLQVGSPDEIYEHPANRFVADFIGQTNFLDGTVRDSETVVLANGSAVAAPSRHTAGTKVALSLRPERIIIRDRGDNEAQPGTDGRGLNGVIRDVTYMGNSLAYTVAIDWMEVEVRTENRPSVARLNPGTNVALTWLDTGASVVAD